MNGIGLSPFSLLPPVDFCSFIQKPNPNPNPNANPKPNPNTKPNPKKRS